MSDPMSLKEVSTKCDSAAHFYNLGIIFRDEKSIGITHPFFSVVLNAFKNEAEAHGYDVTFINHEISGEKMSFLDHCRYRRVDGVCLVCINFNTDEVQELVESEIPCVTIDHRFKKAAAVFSDNENGVNMLVDHAVSLGHRRIAFIRGHNNSIVTTTRIKQFQSAMQYHGLPIPEEYLQSGLYNDIALTRKIVIRLMRLPEPPTCILLPDDYCYFGAQDAARKLDLRIPEDISFAGYDGISLTQSLSPALTTIHQDCLALGTESARKLISVIEQPDKKINRVSIYPVKLIPGGTIAEVK